MNRRISFFIKFLLLLVAMFMTTSALAQKNEVKKQPVLTIATVGVYILDLYDFNLPQKSFKVKGYMWWSLNPTKNAYNPYAATEITNSKEEVIKEITTQYLPPGIYGAKFAATVKKNWNLTKFPFDRQRLQIIFSDTGYNVHTLQYVADQSSGIKAKLSNHDWEVTNFSIAAGKDNYDDNFGGTKVLEAPISDLVVTVDVQRINSGWMFFYIFIGSFVAATLCILSFFTRTDSDIRFSLFLGSVFSVVGNQYLLYNFLPMTSEFTLGDKVQIATFILLILTMIIDITLKKVAEKKQKRKGRYINNGLGFLICFSYVFYIVYSVRMAILN